MKNIRQFSGFTLVELMVTVAIAAILLAVAAPSFTTLISGSNADSYTKKLRSAFAYARNEAVNRGVTIRVCASTNTTACSGGSATWGSGWIIFIDTDDDVVIDAGEEVLRVEDTSSLNVTVDDNGAALAFSAVCFNNLGRECDGAVLSATFTANSNGQQSSITLFRTGLVSN